MKAVDTDRLVALQRTDQFVGRTINWLYDHLRFVPRYTPVVLCDLLANRSEFPLMKAWSLKREKFTRRLWHRLAGNCLYPSDALRLKWLAPCILHSHFGYVAATDLSERRPGDLPWVVSFYGADVYQVARLEGWQERYAQVFEHATLVLALGPVMATHLEYLGCPNEKIFVHPLGVDVEALPSEPRVLRRKEPLKILFAGTFREKKGLPYVIQAAALAQRAGVRLWLHLVGDAAGKPGDGETKDEVFGMVRSLGLENIVTHYSFLPFQELIELALKSHVFVAPSVTAADGDAEGTPFVLQQMMATAMPVIATTHSDIPYLFGKHAHLLVPERDASAIAERLQRYVDDPDALVTDGMAMREQTRRAFNVRACAARLSNLYDVSRSALVPGKGTMPKGRVRVQ